MDAHAHVRLRQAHMFAYANRVSRHSVALFAKYKDEKQNKNKPIQLFFLILFIRKFFL
jgi:hypothetical protein